MAVVLGMNAKLFYRTTPGAGDWSEVCAQDVTLSLTKDEADVTDRCNNGWNATVATMKNAEVSFSFNWDPERPDFIAFKDAWFDDSEIELLVLDGELEIGNGLLATCDVMTFTRTEPLREAVKAEILCKPNGSIPPVWIEGGYDPDDTGV